MKTIKELESEYNIHPRQSVILLEWCDFNLHLLESLLYRLRMFYYSCRVPKDKMETQRILAIPLDITRVCGMTGRIIEHYKLPGFRVHEYACLWDKGLAYFWQRRFNFKFNHE